MNLREIAQHLKAHHRTVALWVVDHAEDLPSAPMAEEVKRAEMDELFTFIGDKKQHSYLYTSRSQNSIVQFDYLLSVICNSRQLYKQRYPKYSAHLMDFTDQRHEPLRFFADIFAMVE